MTQADAIRSRVYALENEERQPGIRCVDAAIRHRGGVIGAMSVTGPTNTVSQTRYPGTRRTRHVNDCMHWRVN